MLIWKQGVSHPLHTVRGLFYALLVSNDWKLSCKLFDKSALFSWKYAVLRYMSCYKVPQARFPGGFPWFLDYFLLLGGGGSYVKPVCFFSIFQWQRSNIFQKLSWPTLLYLAYWIHFYLSRYLINKNCLHRNKT